MIADTLNKHTPRSKAPTQPAPRPESLQSSWDNIPTCPTTEAFLQNKQNMYDAMKLAPGVAPTGPTPHPSEAPFMSAPGALIDDTAPHPVYPDIPTQIVTEDNAATIKIGEDAASISRQMYRNTLSRNKQQYSTPIQALKASMSRFTHATNIDLYDHFVAQAYVHPGVLFAVMNKLLPNKTALSIDPGDIEEFKKSVLTILLEELKDQPSVLERIGHRMAELCLGVPAR